MQSESEENEEEKEIEYYKNYKPTFIYNGSVTSNNRRQKYKSKLCKWATGNVKFNVKT